MGLRWLALAGLITATVLVAVVLRDREPIRGEYCLAEVGSSRAQVDLEQARWSTLMAAIAARRDLPPRATTIAIATAFQESKIHNIDYGDRDSLGLFQQRPSQGWGTPEEIMDPVYAIGRFYDSLVVVPGYQDMEITDAAQRVQRSGFPEAYAQHEPRARALASSLRGHSPAAFSCRLNAVGGGRPRQVVEDVTGAFGTMDSTVEKSRIRFGLSGGEVSVRGWTLAHYLVGNAARLRIAEVGFDGMRWDAAADRPQWREQRGAGSRAVVVRVG